MLHVDPTAIYKVTAEAKGQFKWNWSRPKYVHLPLFYQEKNACLIKAWLPSPLIP